ncbi:unnamed protein product [Vitrella brassicaformis CCMP3155]|uniref:Uncharacterized protein n=1 Tax=Vitrella brassicaformis (strain CCMP3155) TaxID=1169540 RepID=A0A0G4ECF1_VITBC|nr:unnamed protein product [Vitrella brassicaformis CCMP3155]|eukprot:CEL93621.1 unnamed protein product [Vitrella brassicaformis CCMP3155]
MLVLLQPSDGIRDEPMFGMDIFTTEPRVDISGRPFPCTSQQHCVCPWGPRCVFKYASPATAALAREALGDAVAPIVFDWIDDSDDDSDDDDSDDGDNDGSSDNGDGDMDDGSPVGSEGDDHT